MTSFEREPTSLRVERHNSQEARRAEQKKRGFRRTLALALTTVTAIAGLSYMQNRSTSPKAVAASEAVVKPPSNPEGKNIKNPELVIGSERMTDEGIFTIHIDKLNVRKQPSVIEETATGESNKYNLKDDITVVNPVYVKTDANGDWWLATDAEGKNYFFTGTNGGITPQGSDKYIKALVKETEAKVDATTSAGNSGTTKDGERIMLATIVELKNS